jgi:diguanylate cyclase (GGDEF)-like protein
MPFQKIHPSEARRQKALQEMALCESPIDPYLESLSRLMQHVLSARTVLVSTLDQSRYWKQSTLSEASQVCMDALFCAQSTLGGTLKWGSVKIDQQDRDLYREDIRFFASAPLKAPNGLVIGALSFVSEVDPPHKEEHRQQFLAFAKMAEGYLQMYQLKKQSKRLRETLDAVEKKAMTDPLTQALNRSGLERFYVVKQHEASIDQQGLAVLYCDLDYFKRINDQYGHSVGDMALKLVATTIHNVIGNNSILVRQGGEEFVVLSICASADHAHALAESIRLAVENEPLKISDTLVKLTLSIGIAFGAPDLPLLDMLNAADKALYKAKNQGRNRCIGCDDQDSCAA